VNTLTLTLLFLQKDQQVLLALKKRGFGEGKWNGIGGKVEVDETIEEALLRETVEEICVTPTSYEKRAIINFEEFYKGQPTIMNVHVFVASSWEGEPTETEEMAPGWFTTNTIPYEKMWSDDPYWLPQVLAGDKVQAAFVLDAQDNILSHSVQEVEQLVI
jgi:8-oxo-dGTP pyrophosphatase MutT (NUDIX family)